MTLGMFHKFGFIDLNSQQDLRTVISIHQALRSTVWKLQEDFLMVQEDKRPFSRGAWVA